MIGVTSCEKRASKQFSKHIKNWTKDIPDRARAIPVSGGRDGTPTLGETVFIPDSDIHHVFDPELMLAISHSIEDMAEEVGEGELIATFQHFDNFLPQKKRYRALAEKLDAVRVWGAGEPPKRLPKIDFVVADHPRMLRYWIVLFESSKCRAVLLCRQINKSAEFADKKWVGFYSFNPYLVQSIRWRFNLLSSGLERVLAHWESCFALPPVKVAEVKKKERELKLGLNGE